MEASLAATTQSFGHWRELLPTPGTEPRQDLPNVTRKRGRRGPEAQREGLIAGKPAGGRTTPPAAADSASWR